MTNAHILRVFVDENGKFGDSAPVIMDEGKKLSDAERQALTVRLKAAETVFVNDIASANISITHAQGEIDFAGFPLLAQLGFLQSSSISQSLP